MASNTAAQGLVQKSDGEFTQPCLGRQPIDCGVVREKSYTEKVSASIQSLGIKAREELSV